MPGRSESPWGSIILHNDMQKGLENLFKRDAAADPPLEGEGLLDLIREDISHMQFVHPDIVINYEIYKRIGIFLESRGVNVPQNQETGEHIGRRVIAAI